MKIAVASGKGGTGKTTVAASLTAVWPTPLIAMDLDVEAPNLGLFLSPEFTGQRQAYMEVPEVDESRCNYCRACAEICQFKAISVFPQVVMTFPEMCHGCGGCLAVCPEGALRPGRRLLGDISWGMAGANAYLEGRLRVGEAMSPPLMRQVKQRLGEMLAEKPADVIIDAPPGVSCPAINAVMDADVIVLVTEPTPFGRYDLELAVEAFTPLDIPMGIVLNRAGLGDDRVAAFCEEKGLPLLAEIPYARSVAEAYARGEVIARATPALGQRFRDLTAAVRALAASPAQEVCHV